MFQASHSKKQDEPRLFSPFLEAQNLIMNMQMEK